MDPFFGIPMQATPPAEVRECMKTQLGADVYFARDGALGEVTPSAETISPEEIAVARRFCTTLQ